MFDLKLPLLFLSLLTIPAHGEVLSQSFIVRLSEMKQVIEGQKRTIEESSLKNRCGRSATNHQELNQYHRRSKTSDRESERNDEKPDENHQ